MYSINIPRPVRQLLLLITFVSTVCLIQCRLTPSRIKDESPALSRTQRRNRSRCVDRREKRTDR